MRGRNRLAALLLFLGCTGWAWAQLPPLLPSQKAPLSDRVVAYHIDVRYDAQKHSLDAQETLAWTNRTGRPQDRIPFHLYLNAFQPNSTFMKETRLVGTRGTSAGAMTWEDKKNGADEIKSLEVVGMGDLTKQIKFIHPDDDNGDDRTVMEVQLPRPVAPNQTITFKITFHDQFPEVMHRTGYKRDFLLAGQWFPKVGVWWKNAWNCHQFHANSEFFADFSTYDVNLTVPANFNLGATGVQTAEKRNLDGTKTVSFHAEDVIDFAWTADPRSKIVEDSVNISSGNVKIRLIMEPEHMSSVPRYMKALKGTLQKFDEWIGPYPYSVITVVDPPPGGENSGGMEYPTFITAGTSWWLPRGLLEPEMVVEHEFGHQYWYAMVATNEFEDAWLDEGINSYVEVKIMDALYGRDTSALHFRLGDMGEREQERLQYQGVADLDPLTSNAWEYVNGGSYGGNTYGKTATMLLTLEHIIGEKEMLHALHVYYDRYKFKHPTEEDFMNTVNEATGKNLDWYWKQAVRGTQVLDYEVLSAGSAPTGVTSTKKLFPKKGETEYLTTVVVHRKGEFVMPVTLEVKFDNGESLRENWDGQDRWHRFSWVKKARLESAEIDPDHAILLDHDRYNNSWLREPDTHAAGKLAGYWMLLVQWLAMKLAWLV